MDEQIEEVVNVKSELEAPHMPGMAAVMVVIGVLSIIGGVILCARLWPGDPGPGYAWKAPAYVPAVTWLFSGFISGVLFFACAAALTYLDGIREYAKAIAHSLRGEDLEDEVEDLQDCVEKEEDQLEAITD